MDKSFLNEIVEARLLSERMYSKYSQAERERRRMELLGEMAFTGGEFKDYLMSRTTDIVTLFALIKEAATDGTDAALVGHWRGELKRHIMEFQQMDTKPRPGDRDMVSRTLRERWMDEMELGTHPEFVARRFRAGFSREGKAVSSAGRDLLARAFISEMPHLIREMSYGSESSTGEYVDGL